MLTRRLPLLIDFGPQGWFQYFIAMFGLLGAGAGLLIISSTSQDKAPYDIFYAAIIILGGLYVFVMGYVIVIEPHWLNWSVRGIVLMGVALGFLYLYKFPKRFAFLQGSAPYFVKILLLAWMSILLACFLLDWGAPIEFWQILDRLGINVNAGSLLRTIQHMLRYFFQ